MRQTGRLLTQTSFQSQSFYMTDVADFRFSPFRAVMFAWTRFLRLRWLAMCLVSSRPIFIVVSEGSNFDVLGRSLRGHCRPLGAAQSHPADPFSNPMQRWRPAWAAALLAFNIVETGRAVVLFSPAACKSPVSFLFLAPVSDPRQTAFLPIRLTIALGPVLCGSPCASVAGVLSSAAACGTARTRWFLPADLSVWRLAFESWSPLVSPVSTPFSVHRRNRASFRTRLGSDRTRAESVIQPSLTQLDGLPAPAAAHELGTPFVDDFFLISRELEQGLPQKQ
jgi:two-component system sensor histidine kinase RegB